MSREAFPGLRHQDDPQEIDVDDVGDLAVDAHAFDEHVVAWLGDRRVALPCHYRPITAKGA
jgi:hypothetical protein